MIRNAATGECDAADVSVWIDGRRSRRIDCFDRGLQYGDGVFETMRVRSGQVRFIDYHMDRLAAGCSRLQLAVPDARGLRAEILRIAARRESGVLKLILTRGMGERGYRPTGTEVCTRILSLHAPPTAPSGLPVRVRICRTRLGWNTRLAGLKTLNRLESVLARMEWRDPRIWEGLMLDADGCVVCGTMSNLFLRRGADLMTPLLDRCGVAGVTRRWVLREARGLGLRASQSRIVLADLRRADELFLCNAIAGVIPVAEVRVGTQRIRPACFETAAILRARLEDR